MASSLVPEFVTSPGKGRAEVVEQWTAADGDNFVADLRALEVLNPKKAKRRQPLLRYAADPEEADPPSDEEDGGQVLSVTQRKMLEEAYDRDADGGPKRFQLVWAAVRDKPGAPTNAQAKEWMAEAPTMVLCGRADCYMTMAEKAAFEKASGEEDKAAGKPTAKWRNGVLVVDTGEKKASKPEPEPEPEPAEEELAEEEPAKEEPAEESEPPARAYAYEPEPRGNFEDEDDGGLFDEDEDEPPAPALAPKKAQPAPVQKDLFEDQSEEEQQEPEQQEAPAPAPAPVLKKESKAAADVQPNAAAKKAKKAKKAKAAPAAKSLAVAIDRIQKVKGKTFYHVVWQGAEGPKVETWRRYSEFDELKTKLVGLVGPSISELPFPKKKAMRGNSAKVTAERTAALDAFLSGLLVDPGLVMPNKTGKQAEIYTHEFLHLSSPLMTE